MISGNASGIAVITGQRVELNGVYENDVFVFGENIVINGNIKGNLFSAASTIQINGVVEGRAFCAGRSITTAHGSSVFELSAVSEDVFINGNIHNSVYFAAGNIELNGNVKGNIHANCNSLKINNSAVVEGYVKATTFEKPLIAQGANVKGGLKISEKMPVTATETATGLLTVFIKNIAGGLILWAMMIFAFPKMIGKTVLALNFYKRNIILNGLFLFFVIPFVTIALIFTLIAMDYGLITLFAYLSLVYLARNYFAVSLGIMLASRYNMRSLNQSFWPVTGILAILYGIDLMPFAEIKLFTWLTATILGLGLFAVVIKPVRKRLEIEENTVQ